MPSAPNITETMKAATVVEFNKPLQILELLIPTPEADQILVKVLASSLCNSDLAAWMGLVGAKIPYCAGHEREYYRAVVKVLPMYSDGRTDSCGFN